MKALTACLLVGLLALWMEFPSTIAVRIPREKLGICPRNPFRCTIPGRNSCNNDYNCEGRKKCCYFNCGKICRNPQGSVAYSATETSDFIREVQRLWPTPGDAIRGVDPTMGVNRVQWEALQQKKAVGGHQSPQRSAAKIYRLTLVPEVIMKRLTAFLLVGLLVFEVELPSTTCYRVPLEFSRFCHGNPFYCSIPGIIRRCRHDYDCPQNLRCCNYRCGRSCRMPLPPPPPPPPPPMMPWNCQRFPHSCPVPGIHRCGHDRDCPGRQRCCYHNCARGCR
ncbi:WAP four-disulfide core domain protein 8-like [Anolis sagrei]|uniref:WAP four-disulfide core domain protein 8-like n=1 Tax=Anolis sagrei TaxID=38937 RepID=UPI003520A55C